MTFDAGWRDADRDRDSVRVAAVIPTFRRQREVDHLIDSLLAGSRPPDQIVIVDNDPDRSCTAPVRPGHQIEVVRLGAGLNLPGARNAGWRAAGSADLVFFVDDDNIVAPTTIAELVDALGDPSVGLAAPVIFCAEPDDLIWCGGIERSMWTTKTSLLHRGETELPPPDRWPTQDAPDALAIPRDVLDRVGGFDEENFPFGHDEADITARIARLGLARVVVRDAHIWHEGGMPGIWDEYARSVGLHGHRRLRLNWRGRVLFHRRYSTSALQRLVAIGLFIPAGAAIASIISATAKGSLRSRFASGAAIWRGVVDGYRWTWRDPADELVTERT